MPLSIAPGRPSSSSVAAWSGRALPVVVPQPASASTASRSAGEQRVTRIWCRPVSDLVLGPAVRFCGREDATVWVETSAPATVEVRPEGLAPARAQTFSIAGHHYAIVHVEGLPPDTPTPYTVALDGDPVWPPADYDFPPSVLRTHAGEHGRATILFGSCRLCVPHEPPYSLTKDQD